MYKLITILFFCLFITNCNKPSHAISLQNSAGFSDGEIKTVNNELLAWNKPYENWLAIESFWHAYAARSGGITWGASETYPPYNEVKEFDTLLVELEEGKCLMEFFHSRWRRANDVRRWDEKHNQYGGCPYVFD